MDGGVTTATEAWADSALLGETKLALAGAETIGDAKAARVVPRASFIIARSGLFFMLSSKERDYQENRVPNQKNC